MQLVGTAACGHDLAEYFIDSLGRGDRRKQEKERNAKFSKCHEFMVAAEEGL
jgi:hypothetical protein